MFAIWIVCIMPETFTGLAISCRCECTHPAVIRPSTEVGWADSSRWTRTWSGSSPSDSFEHHPSEVGVETVESVIVSVNNPIAICLNLNAKQKKLFGKSHVRQYSHNLNSLLCIPMDGISWMIRWMWTFLFHQQHLYL